MGLLNHYFVSGIADGADPLEIQPQRDWNDDHAFSGGNVGAILLRDSSVPKYGASWVNSVGVGQVLVSAGIGVLPAWSASPTLTSVLTSVVDTNVDGVLAMKINNTTRWNFGASGTAYAVYPAADNGQDVGTAGFRARSGYFGTALAVGASPAASGAIRLDDGAIVNSAGSLTLKGTLAGALLLDTLVAPAASGTRYLIIDTAGKVTSSASPPVGT